MKNVKSNSVNKTGVVEDKVEVEEVEAKEVGQPTQELSASNVGSTDIFPKITTRTNDIIVGK